MSSYYPFYYAMLISTLIPIIIGIIGFRRLGPELKILWGLLVISVLVDLYTFRRSTVYGVNSQSAHFFYILIEYCVYAFVFSFWQDKRLIKNMFRYSMIFIVLIGTLRFSSINNAGNFESFFASLTSVLFVIISAYTLFALQLGDFGSIYKNFRFWISAGLLLYAAGSIGFLAFINIHRSTTVWIANVIVNIISYFLYGTGFIFNIREKARNTALPSKNIA